MRCCPAPLDAAPVAHDTIRVPRKRSEPQPRAERVYSPPADLLLTEGDLRAWLAAIAPALSEAGLSLDLSLATVREVSPPDWTVSAFDAAQDRLAPACTVARPRQIELRLRMVAPSWVRASALDLRLTGDGACEVLQRSGYASALAVRKHLDKRAPRWRLPPQGALPFAVGLRERNGWEGEAWTYWFPLSAEADVLALATGSPVASGCDVRCAPWDPASLATFGSWSLDVRYCPEWRARYCCETSRCGYMPYQNWSGETAQDLAELLAEARERGILQWQASNDGAGLRMWKARVALHDEDGEPLRTVNLA